MCFLLIILVSCLFILVVLGPWEFSGRPGHVFLCVCGSAVWSAWPVQFYLDTFMERMAGLHRFFLFFSGSVVAVRYGRNGEGGGFFFSCFLPFAVSFLGGWVSVVGFLCYIFRFSLVDLWYYLAVSYFEVADFQ